MSGSAAPDQSQRSTTNIASTVVGWNCEYLAMTGGAESERALDALHREAIMWAGGGPAQPLVDAAVDALVAGFDAPTLRVLAGAPGVSADEEADDLAPDLFDELGLDVAPRLSLEAVLIWARWSAQEFLDGGGRSPRLLARNLYVAWYNNGYPSELDGWSGLNEDYVMLDDGITRGSYGDVDEAVRAEALRLASGASEQ